LGAPAASACLIALYDTLAGDLRRAAEAERATISRSGARKRITHCWSLRTWRMGSPAEMVETWRSSLPCSTGLCARKMIEAQAKRSPEILEQQIALVLEVRTIWQGLELSTSSSAVEVPAWVQTSTYPGGSPHRQRSESSWSA
jgi:hypothetical protein